MGSSKASCSVCNNEVDHLIQNFESHEGSMVAQQLQLLKKQWNKNFGICSFCLDELHHRVIRQLSKEENDILTPLPVTARLNSNTKYTGKGVTICMIDSGFYLHPDIEDRVLKIHDITNPDRPSLYYEQPHNDSWHGTMTSVVAAGDGSKSNGLYHGIAYNAKLVLIKVMNGRGISSESITKALNWAIEHKDQYGINVINLSVTDDWPVSYKESQVDRAVQRAIEIGISVVAAVGNDASAPIKPPANSPWVISVGGVDDYNTLGYHDSIIYHSTYGRTVDRFNKPEIISPSIWIPIPILPHTALHRKAKALFQIYEAPEDKFWENLMLLSSDAGIVDHVNEKWTIPQIKSLVREKIHQEKFVNQDYMHGDGTSFSAPIVSSVIAQMIEANNSLLPHEIRDIILNNATFLQHIPAEIQGFGLINPYLSIKHAMVEKHGFPDRITSPEVSIVEDQVMFYYHNDLAKKVEVVGSFNQWKEKIPMKINAFGLWQAAIPIPPKGKYYYKYLVDEKKWIVDPGNLYSELNGVNGFNSILKVKDIRKAG
ncbi:MAG TPA: S8 family serine peptidase [Cyclobacteriaceae bacterium]